MPALSPTRQPEVPLAWFSSAAGQGLLAVEAAAMTRVLAGCPAMPWAWMGVAGAVPPETAGGRGVSMRRKTPARPGHAAYNPGPSHPLGFDGALRCALPLPLANESFGAVLLQHALDDAFAPDELLGECERILAPGGILWLAALNPWSPYRMRWARSGLHARATGSWQASLRRAGFALDSVSLQWLGPHWRVGQGDVGVGMADWLRAGIALSVCKRVHALIPPTPLRNLRWQPGGAARTAAIMRR